MKITKKNAMEYLDGPNFDGKLITGARYLFLY